MAHDKFDVCDPAKRGTKVQMTKGAEFSIPEARVFVMRSGEKREREFEVWSKTKRKRLVIDRAPNMPNPGISSFALHFAHSQIHLAMSGRSVRARRDDERAITQR